MDELICIGYWQFAWMLAIPSVMGFVAAYGVIWYSAKVWKANEDRKELDRRENKRR